MSKVALLAVALALAPLPALSQGTPGKPAGTAPQATEQVTQEQGGGQVGRLLGLGDKVVSISGDRLREIGDRLQLQMPEAK